MMDLFGEVVERHSAGGKAKTSLPAGVRGDAEFYGEKDVYRPVLRRWIGEEFPLDFIMFVGMNPSSAEEETNDPTIGREWSFTVREGFSGFWKGNVADYRATFPSDFRKIKIPPMSEINLERIRDAADRASVIVVCHGNLIKPLRNPGLRVLDVLKRDGRKLMCFGTNADNSPKHPLYLKKTAPLIEWHP